MSHHDCAQIWYELEGRHDLNFILRDAFGRVWLSHRESAFEVRIEALLLAKLVFDYQRYVIRTAQFQNNPLLLDTELVFFIGCIIQIVNKLPPKAQGENPHYSDVRSLARQAFTSGIRVLILPAGHQNQDRGASIINLLKSWTAAAEEDEQILKKFIAASIEDLRADYNAQKSTQHCRHTRFLEHYPDYPQSLHHSLESLRQVASSVRSCIEEDCAWKHRSFWEWMDLELVLVVTSYQSLACDLQSSERAKCHHLGHHDSDSKAMFPDDLKTLSRDWGHVQRHLAPSVINSPMKQYGIWLRKLQPLPLCPASHGTHCFPSGVTSLNDSNKLLRKCLRELCGSLQVRAHATNRSTKPMRHILESTRQEVALWIGPPASSQRSQESLDLDFRMYALSCPKAHVIRHDQLYGLLQSMSDDIDAGLDNLESDHEAFSVWLRCPHCEREHPQQPQRLWARKIIPLDRLPSFIQFSEPLRLPDQQSPMLPPSTSQIPTVPQTPESSGPRSERLRVNTSVSPSSSPSNVSPSQDGSTSPASRQVADKKSHKSNLSENSFNRLKQRLRTKPRNSSPNSPTPKLKLVISSDGKLIVVHSSQLASCYSFTSQAWSVLSVHGTGFQCVAASFQFCALADKSSTDAAPESWHLRIHSSVSGNEVPCSPLPKSIKYPIKSLAFSQDGSRLAMGTETLIAIIDTADFARWQFVALPPAPEPSLAIEPVQNTQVLSFTPDGAFACLATRFRPSGKVLTVIIQDDKRSSPIRPCNPKQSVIDARLTSDHGLTAIACTHTGGTINYLICSSTNASGPPKVRTYPIQEPIAEQGRSPSTSSNHARQDSGSCYELHDGKHPLDQKLQGGVALEALGNEFIVASDEGQLFHISLKRQETKHITGSGAIHRPGGKGTYDPVQMAVTNDRLVRIAWLEDGVAKIVEVDTSRSFQLNPFTVTLKPYTTEEAPHVS